MLLKPFTVRRLSVFTPATSYCRPGGFVRENIFQRIAVKTAKTLTIRISVSSPHSVDELERLIDSHWADSTARRLHIYSPKSARPARDTPPNIVHFSPIRTLEFYEDKATGRTLITHDSQLRICPAGMY